VAIYISNGWDVAHHHIGEGFIHLGQAYAHNRYATQKYLNYEKNLRWTDCFGASMEVRQYFIAENKQSIKATILFQAGMEAWISWAYTKPQLSAVKVPKPFVSKWTKAFKQLGSEYDFSEYKKFYRKVRNPIVHPSKQSDIEKVASVWCKPVYEGLKAGWSAMSLLSAELGMPFDSNSWDTMCNITDTPKSIDYSEVSDLQLLEREMNKRHLKGARDALSADG
jgi:hypothetical protein